MKMVDRPVIFISKMEGVKVKERWKGIVEKIFVLVSSITQNTSVHVNM